MAAGLAAGLRLTGEDGLVFTVLGDGECEEGQVWEAAMFAAHQKLGRLVAIIDNNELQIDGCIHDVCDPGIWARSSPAFGWDVQRVCGHDIPALVELFGPHQGRGGRYGPSGCA